ncbi:UNVERIFIED_CONTAM: response regulator transcription factor [Methylobacteriaceae bacterium AG10]|nr:response regulator transcription factor [Methylobacteriaceae bacterium AG10]
MVIEDGNPMQIRKIASDNLPSGLCTEAAVRIVIADDHHVVRRGVRAILECRANWEVVAEAVDGAEALEIVEAEKPDVAIIDYSLPIMNGAQLTKRIRAISPQTEVLIFTMHDSEVLIRDVLKAGAKGYLVKSDAEDLLVRAVEALSRRQPYVTDWFNRALLDRYLASPEEPGELTCLTAREREVVQLVAEGNSSKGVSQVLDISPKTVETYRASAMHKLGLKTTAALVRYAIRNKLVEP